MGELAKELEKLFGRLKFMCRCAWCGYEWVYVPHSGIPARHVTCPKCHHKTSLLQYCRLVKE
jgi:hypothetical protein